MPIREPSIDERQMWLEHNQQMMEEELLREAIQKIEEERANEKLQREEDNQAACKGESKSTQE